MKTPFWMRFGAVALCFSFSAATAIAQTGDAARQADTFASINLRPGEFLWRDPTDSSAPVDIVVSIGRQTLYVVRDAELLAVSTVSTGRRGHSTPIGDFAVLEKRERHFSNIYDDAPMPFMQRLTWGGIALHAGANPGRPASHGCIRLPTEFARRLFWSTRIGTRIVVTDETFHSEAPISSSLIEFLSGDSNKLLAMREVGGGEAAGETGFSSESD